MKQRVKTNRPPGNETIYLDTYAPLNDGFFGAEFTTDQVSPVRCIVAQTSPGECQLIGFTQTNANFQNHIHYTNLGSILYDDKVQALYKFSTGAELLAWVRESLL